jgi:hypothetical protein
MDAYGINRTPTLFSRSFSYNDKSVLTTIFQYIIELLNLLVSATAIASLAGKLLMPVPFLLSQLIVVLIAAAWTLTFVLGFALSGLKLLLVTHFHVVFPVDPEQVLLHNGGYWNACTIKRCITLQCIPKQRARHRMVVFLNCCLY